MTLKAGEVVLMRTRAAESAGDARLQFQNAITVSLFVVELETRSQAFAIERDALALAAAESAACINNLRDAALAAETRAGQQAHELQETQARY